MIQAVRVHVGATVVIERAWLPESAVRDLRARTTFRHPDADREGYPSHVRLMDRVGDRWFRLPRGSVEMVRRVLGLHRVQVEVVRHGVVSRPAGDVVLASAVDSQLRDYQRAAASALLRSNEAVIQVPTGGGKTRLCVAAVLASRQPALVLVHTEDLLDQWREAFGYHGVRVRAIAGSGSRWTALGAGEIAVGMVQTIARDLGRAGNVLGSAGVAVFDEVHKAPAASWMEVARRLPAAHRWGLTATPERADGLGFLIPLLVGPIVYRLASEILIRRGFLASPTILPVDSGWAPPPECFDARRRLKYATAQTKACGSAGVLDRVIRLAAHGAEHGRSGLVLVPRVPAVRAIVEGLRADGIAAVGIHGTTARSERSGGIDAARVGDAQVLVATTLADEGLDVPGLDWGVSLMSGRAAGRAKQRLGRLLRRSGRPPVWFELVHQGKHYDRQWRDRARTYRGEYGAGSVPHPQPMSVDDALRVAGAAPPDRQRQARGR